MSQVYEALVKSGRKDRTAGPLSFSWQRISFDWKVMVVIGGVMLAVALVVVVLVQQRIGRALRSQIERRSLIMAINLSDAAAGPAISKNLLELHALVTKYARLEGVAYALIEDPKGNILAQSPGGGFKSESPMVSTLGERREIATRVVEWTGQPGRTVHETRTPILEGRIGAARVGIWEEDVEAEVYRILLPIAGFMSLLLAIGVILSIFLAREILVGRSPAR